MYAVAIFLTYNLQFYIPSTLLWPRICRRILYRYNDSAKMKFEIAFRVGLILITCKCIGSNFLFPFIFTHLYTNGAMLSWILMCLLVTVAALIPNLGLVISLGKFIAWLTLTEFRHLVGAIASTALSLIFPPICETLTFWPNNLGRFKWQLVLNICIVLFGLYIFFAGTALSISNIIACIREGTRCDDWSFDFIFLNF